MPPFLVVKIPGDGFLNTLFKRSLGEPAEVFFDFGRVDCIAHIVTGPCRDKGTAKTLAEKELADDFTYDTVKIAYDRTEGIWKVEFSQNAQGTGKLSVCIEDSGITKLIVKE